MAMGSASAPVTVIEYASVACPHCAAFNNQVFPAFKAKYIDTGRARFIAREALTGDTGLAAAGFLTARCAGSSRYFEVLDAIYHAQAQMFASGAPQRLLLAIAERAGLTEQQFEACITNPAALSALNARWAHAMRDEGIHETPTFVINGKVYLGEMTMAELDTALAKPGAAGGRS